MPSRLTNPSFEVTSSYPKPWGKAFSKSNSGKPNLSPHVSVTKYAKWFNHSVAISLVNRTHSDFHVDLSQEFRIEFYGWESLKFPRYPAY